MNVALLRVSTDEQDTRNQRLDIEKFAKDKGMPVDHWYEDKESRDFSNIRPEFLAMMKEVQAGKIKSILIQKFDRFGVSGKREWFYWAYVLQQAGCRLLSTLPDEGELTAKDDATMIKLFFKASASSEEQKNIGHRTLKGRWRRAEQGCWTGGPAPLGYDKACLDHAGNTLWILERIGKKEYLQHFPNGHRIKVTGSPGAGKGESLRLRVNQAQAEAVRYIFRIWTQERISLSGLALRLNQEGRRLHGKPFTGMGVRVILSNPVYTGQRVFNRRPQGRFWHLCKGELVDIPEEEREELRRKGRKTKRIIRRSNPENWVVSADDALRIIDDTTWDVAQRKLADVRDNKGHAHRKDQYWLRGILHCGGCGQPMKAETHKGRVEYFCKSWEKAYRTGLAQNCKCGRNVIPGLAAEAMIEAWLDEEKVNLANAVLRPEDFQTLFEASANTKALLEPPVGEGFQAYLRRMKQDLVPSDPTSEEETLGCLIDAMHLDRSGRGAALDTLKTEVCKVRLAAMNGEWKEVLRSKHRAQSDREVSFWEAEQVQIEKRIERYEAWAVPLEHRLKEGIRRCQLMVVRLKEALRLIQNGGARQKAEALRSILPKVVLHFTRTENKARAVRRIIEAMPEASSREIAERATALGYKIESKNISLLKKHKPVQNRHFYRVEKVDWVSPLLQSASRTR